MSTTREPGAIIGNGLKTIFSRITTMDEASTALQGVNISIKDLGGNVKPVSKILGELAGKWGTLSDEQRQNLGVTLAGRFQLSRFLALMNNFSISQKASATAADSMGSSMKEQSKYANSLEARINRLDTAWTKFTLSAGQAFLTDGLIGAVETLGELANIASVVVSKVGVLPIVFGTIGVAVTLLSTKLRVFSTAMIFGSNSMRVAALESVGLTAGMSRAAIATMGLSVAFKGLLASTGVGLLLVGVGIALEAIIKKYSEAKQAQEDFEKAQQTNIDALTTNKSKTEELISSYKALSAEKASGGAWNSDKEKEYLKIQSKLSETYPALIKSVDATGQAHLKSSEQIDKEIKLTNGLIQAKKEELKVNALDNIKDSKGNLDDIQGKIDKQKKYLEGFKNVNNPFYSLSGKENEKIIKQTETQLAQLQIQYANAATSINDEALKIAGAFNTLEINPNIQKSIDNIVNSLDLSKLNPAQIEGFSKRLAELEDQLQKASNSGNKQGFDETVTSINNLFDKMSSGNKDTNNLTISMDDLSKSGKDVSQMTLDAGTALDDYSYSADGATTANEQLTKTFNNSKSNITSLNGILNDLNETNKVSADSIATIMEKYPELLPYINDEVTLRKKVSEAIKEEELVAKRAILAKMKDNEQYFTQVFKANKDYFDGLSKMYGVDFKNTKTLAEAKGQVEMALLSELSKKWGEYYNAQSDTFTAQGDELLKSGGYYGLKMIQDITAAKQKSAEFSKSFESISLKGINLDLGNIGLNLDKNTKKTKETKSATEQWVYVEDKLQTALEKVNNQLDAKNAQLDKYAKSSANYRKVLEQENALLQQKNDILNKGTKSIDAQIAANKFITAGKVKKDEAVYDTFYNSPSSNKSNKVTGAYSSAINSASSKYNVNPKIVQAIAKQESILGQLSKNVMQVTHDKMNKQTGSMAEKSIKAGTKYFSEMLKKAGGDLKKALAAYNMGEGILKYFNQHGGYSVKNMQAFAKIMDKKTPGKGYGDSHYVENVLSKLSGTVAQAASKSTNKSLANAADYYLKNYKITSKYGEQRGGGEVHKGLDFSKPGNSDLGDPIKAILGGKVKTATYDSQRGYYVAITQEDGKVVAYHHMRKQPSVKVGQIVKAGQKLGEFGSTGDSTGVHLDIKVKDANGKYQDPEAYLKGLSGKNSEKAADNAQKKADAQKERADLQNQIAQNNKQIQDNLVAISDSWTAQFDADSQALQRQIDDRKSKVDNLDPNSKAYGDTLKSEYEKTKQLEDKQKADLKQFQDWYAKNKAKMNDATRKAMEDTALGMQDKIKETDSAMKQLVADEFARKKEAEVAKLNDEFDKLNKSLDDMVLKLDAFDSRNFTNSINEIINQLDVLDKKFIDNPIAETVTSSVRANIETTKNTIIQLNKEIDAMKSKTSNTVKGMADLIDSETVKLNDITKQIADYANQISETKLQYKQIEDSLQNQIDLKQTQLDQLDKQYQTEDRIKQLNDLMDQRNKAMADKRFSYIDSNGKETLTYDKAKVDDLNKQINDMNQQNAREDAKQAMQDEINAMQKNLSQTQAIHQASIAQMELYQQSLTTLQGKLNSDIESKRTELDKIEQKMVKDTEKAWDDVILALKVGTMTFSQVMDTWYTNTIAGMKTNNASINSEIANVKSALESLQALNASYAAEQAKSISNTPSGGSASGSSGTSKTVAPSTSKTPSSPKSGTGIGSIASKVSTSAPKGSHATGLESVPYDGYIAELHKGEPVLTAEQGNELRNAGILSANSDGTPNLNLANKLFNIKPNGSILNSLKSGIPIPKNIPNLLNGISNMVKSVTSNQQPIVNQKHYHLNNFTVKTDNVTELFNSIDFLIQSEQ